MSIFVEIQELIDTQLKTVTDLPTLYKENAKSSEASTSTWCRSTLLPARTSVASIGTQYQQKYTGLVQVDLFFPKDRNFKNAGNVADAVIAAFPPGLRIEGSDFQIMIEGSWLVAGGHFGTFYNKPVQIEWTVYR